MSILLECGFAGEINMESGELKIKNNREVVKKYIKLGYFLFCIFYLCVAIISPYGGENHG